MSKAQVPVENKYSRLISSWRFRATSEKGRTIAVEAASDRSRVIFCEAFRQLHRKAQVFSLEESGSARTRLTHSLEVAQIGKYIAQSVLEKVNEKLLEKLCLSEKHEALLSFVETACLVHDIGNPPFGHFGELAIKHWFDRHEEHLAHHWCEKSKLKRKEFALRIKDFTNFDGNPQGFRILAKLMWGTDKYSLNLTATQLASSIKYCGNPTEIQDDNPNKKKAGYFLSESEMVNEIAEQLGMKKHVRHPLVYLMEAADDIAYCLSDMEDAINKGLIREKDLLDQIRDKIIKESAFADYAKHLPRQNEDGNYPIGAYLMFRIKCINHIVPLAAKEFIDNHETYFAGTAPPLLEAISSARTLLDFLKSIARSRIYNSPIVLKNELIGSKVICGILDAFLPLLEASHERFEAVLKGDMKDHDGYHISSEKALFHQVPKNYVLVYQDALSKKEPGDKEIVERFHRTHLIVDYLAGLTDSEALELYKLVCSG